MPFRIVRNDITKMQVDAIVNTANEEPIYSSGTDTAVYAVAGAEELLNARRKIGFLNEGEVAITPGFNLVAKYIIHAVSPFYEDGNNGEEEKLRSCYEKSLQLALENDCKSIAFPLIATGSYGYPKAEGMEIALSVIHNFLMKEDMMIYLVVFDKEAVRLSGQIFEDIEAFIDENYVVEKHKMEYGFSCECERISMDLNDEDLSEMVRRKDLDLEDIVKNVGETFQQQLFRLIDERGRDEVEVYKGACKDKKFFYKIRNNVNYQPSKHTVFAFALSLRLTLEETKDLLASAGFALSPSSRFDLIMQYVFEQEIYDMYKIDCILYDFGEEKYFSCE
ncbi:macro domain-containing protein [Anaerosporobacter sp.]